MIDPADQQTQPLPIDEAKRRRGRPATGKAMTPAERQKAYRERLKSQRNVTESESTHDTKSLQLLRERALSRGKTCIAQARMIVELEKRIADLEKQLLSRNSNRVKGISYRALTEAAFETISGGTKAASKEKALEWGFGTYRLWSYLVHTAGHIGGAQVEKDMAKMKEMVNLR